MNILFDIRSPLHPQPQILLPPEHLSVFIIPCITLVPQITLSRPSSNTRKKSINCLFISIFGPCQIPRNCYNYYRKHREPQSKPSFITPLFFTFHPLSKVSHNAPFVFIVRIQYSSANVSLFPGYRLCPGRALCRNSSLALSYFECRGTFARIE